MSKWEENVRKVTPYTPGEQPNRPGMIKLNTNENPYPPAPGVLKAMPAPDGDALRRYPDPAASVLVNALAERFPPICSSFCHSPFNVTMPFSTIKTGR